MIYINSVTIKRGQSTETYTHINCRKCAIVKTKKKKLKKEKTWRKKFSAQYLKGHVVDTQRRFVSKPNSHNKHWLRSRSQASVAI